MPRTTRSRQSGGAGIAGAMILAASVLPLAGTAVQAEDCSGILCMFTGRPAATPAPQPAPAPAPQPVSQPAPQPVSQPAAAPAPAQNTESVDADADAPLKTKPRAKLRPTPVITIAADPAEVGRLKALSSVMPKVHVRIVEAKAKEATADFAVTTALDAPRGVEKAKLFTETMHVVAGPKIHSLADLAGKVVSFGAADSASRATARKAFDALNIRVAETPLDLDNALDGLATGDIDAVVVLAPQPDQRLRKVSAPGLHLVAWPQDAGMPDGAVAASIDAAAYPGLGRPGEKVAALGVDAVLTLTPKGQRQRTARSFLGAVSQHSALLSKRGFDLLKADLDARAGRRVAAAEPR